MGDGEHNATPGTPPWWRDFALFFAGVMVAPPLLTLLSRLGPETIPLWVTDLFMLGAIVLVFFALRWRTFAVGMFVSSVLWIGFTLWLTAQVSPSF